MAELISPGFDFSGSAKQRANKMAVFFLTNKRNLVAILEAGMITPSACQFRYRQDSRELVPGAIPFWKEGLPIQMLNQFRSSETDSVVIAFEMDALSVNSGNDFTIHNDKLLVVSEPVPLAKASAIYFPSAEAIEDFLARRIDGVVCDEASFVALADFPEIAEVGVPKTLVFPDCCEELEFIDKCGGSLKAVEYFSRNGIEAQSFIREFMEQCFLSADHQWKVDLEVDSNDSWIVLGDEDIALLAALLPILRRVKRDERIDPLAVLQKLEKALKSIEPAINEQVEKWITFTRKVLQGEQDVHPLGDEKKLVQRAVLLFLLRPDLDRLLNSMHSNIAAGPTVATMAAFFVGHLVGVSSMGNAQKGSAQEFNQFIDNLMSSVWNRDSINVALRAENSDVIGPAAFLEINGSPLLKMAIPMDQTMRTLSRLLGKSAIEVSYIPESRSLSGKVLLKKGRRQRFFIERIVEEPGEGGSIRIASVCKDLGSKTKLQKLTKARAIEMLKMNEFQQNCCFAYSESKESILVQTTCSAEIADPVELTKLVEHIAAVADDYEKKDPDTKKDLL